MKFRARFNTKKHEASIHAPTCPQGHIPVWNKAGAVCFDVEAPNAKEAARKVYVSEEFEARGMKMPRICECCRKGNPMKRRKGVVPPQLRKFLFKKGHKAVRRKAPRKSRRKRTRVRAPAIRTPAQKRTFLAYARSRGAVVGRRRRRNPVAGRYIITAEKGRLKLHYNGSKMTDRGRSKKYPSQIAAKTHALQLVHRYPVLNSWSVYVRPVPAGK